MTEEKFSDFPGPDVDDEEEGLKFIKELKEAVKIFGPATKSEVQE